MAVLFLETKKLTIEERFLSHWMRFTRKVARIDRVQVSVYAELYGAYAEPWRTYHGLKHLVLLLDELELLRLHHMSWFADHQINVGVEFSLWVHDLVAHPTLTDGELKSAVRGRHLIAVLGYPHLGDMVHRCTLATRHRDRPERLDEQIVADIDLSLLACRFEEFRQTTADIRQEQKHKSDAEFAAGQRAFLGHLQKRGVYATRHYQYELEASAQANIRRSLAEQAAV